MILFFSSELVIWWIETMTASGSIYFICITHKATVYCHITVETYIHQFPLEKFSFKQMSLIIGQRVICSLFHFFPQKASFNYTSTRFLKLQTYYEKQFCGKSNQLLTSSILLHFKYRTITFYSTIWISQQTTNILLEYNNYCSAAEQQ